MASRVDGFVVAELKKVGPKPPDRGSRSDVKKNYSEKVSAGMALAFAAELRARNLKETLPAPPVATGKGKGKSGAERRMAGGLGAKKVDVTWVTEASGLGLAISVKTINFRDLASGNFQKNLTNRRGDMLFEAVTLHRRFPYAVLGGFFFLDREAANDQTALRRSTFENAHPRFSLFTGRDDPAGRDEQYERIFIVLLDSSNPSKPAYTVHSVGDPKAPPITFDDAFDQLIEIVAERNPDFYEFVGGELRRV